MRPLTALSPAKLNLFLEVTGKRPDGYHDIESVFLAVDLCDRLTLAAGPGEEVSLEADVPWAPTDRRNLAAAAAASVKRLVGAQGGVHIKLEKRIPAGGGLGGGSSNAATALRLANEWWRGGLSDADLSTLGAELGSDVPFFLHGGLCLCRGRGEAVTPLPPFPRDVRIGIVLSDLHSSTADAYRGLRLPEPGRVRTADAFLRALAAGDGEAMAAEAFNRFEETVFAALPELRAIHAGLERAGLRVRMSGSGSGLWYFGTAAMGEEALRNDAELAGLAARHGVRIVEAGAVRSSPAP